MRDYMDIAVLAAKQAGKIHTKYFNTDFQVKSKGSSFDLVTFLFSTCFLVLEC